MEGTEAATTTMMTIAMATMMKMMTTTTTKTMIDRWSDPFAQTSDWRTDGAQPSGT
jgi:hypothetical protein